MIKINIEELQEQLLNLQEQLKTFKTENETLKNKLSEKEQREKELMEYNNKLFMRITTEQTKEEKQEEIPHVIDKDTYNILSDTEKQILQEILEEE